MNKTDDRLRKNPAWLKVQRFSDLQEIFLFVSLSCVIIHHVFDAEHPYWIISFLIFGVLSVIFGYISMNTLRKHFALSSNTTEETEKGN